MVPSSRTLEAESKARRGFLLFGEDGSLSSQVSSSLKSKACIEDSVNQGFKNSYCNNICSLQTRV